METVEQASHEEAEVRKLAQQLWDNALVAADRHPYALLWGVNAQRLKVYRADLLIEGARCDGALLMPMRDTAGVVWNAGFLTAISTVRFLPGGRIANTYFGWGADRSTIIVCRSFAKAAEINTASGHAVAVAGTTDNVENIAGIMRDRYPQARVVLATDFRFASQRTRGEVMAAVAPLATDQGLVMRDPNAEASLLLDWIERKQRAEFTRSQVLQLGPSRLRNAGAAKRAMEALVEHGRLVTEDGTHYRVPATTTTPSKDLPA